MKPIRLLLATVKSFSLSCSLSSILLLGLAWWVSFYYNEVFWINHHLATNCSWEGLQDATPSEWHNFVMIADPQLIDNHTYPGRPEPLLQISKFTTDRYLKKNYRAIVKQLRSTNPSASFNDIVFLGDYLDNGRSASDSYYSHELQRFRDIFQYGGLFDVAGKDASKIHLALGLPGNHDIGWADGVKSHAMARFKADFGTPNSVKSHSLGDKRRVEFVTLDTLSLSAKALEINGEARKFLDTFTVKHASDETVHRVLLTHVPLYRSNDEGVCGADREAKRFPLVQGYQYQTVIDNDLSQEILQKVQPDLVYSGDDHDYCDVTHTYQVKGKQRTAREITVKSFSMAMGIKYPAFQMLSIRKNAGAEFYRTKMCYLPTPYMDILQYVVLAAISLLVILYGHLRMGELSGFFSMLAKNVRYSGLPLHTEASPKPRSEVLKSAAKDCVLLGGIVCVSYAFMILI
ncbi:hypothetical protein BABINDRAFT_162635 [Babjeviella inositovora NRRL Y-12698]|uniref:Calcineurin-like phosphoesterase domain-containing protein n=1 Tax=Babjeviella inositovora NRRL Y-12698 TaxID=984486 RepID=A0A1E3QL72_9ASCO|nr:uncharacterized protein BABINDRAFT_162635 [Babjeviella inositovora NRRL Y-12698]ODQ78400.1 hypothetical protein BABINDRAFT_162635 [Babjeviella inositovora NRRL Y-12698]